MSLDDALHPDPQLMLNAEQSHIIKGHKLNEIGWCPARALIAAQIAAGVEHVHYQKCALRCAQSATPAKDDTSHGSIAATITAYFHSLIFVQGFETRQYFALADRRRSGCKTL